jgi:coenzyme F420-reducing hydrogenase gamma subunit
MPVGIHTLPTCGACCKRTGLPCRQPAMQNGRCRLHGGKSTGPRTEKGRNAIAKACTKHGFFSQRNQAMLKVWKKLISDNYS